MTDESNIAGMLAVAGLFTITFYLLRDPVGDAESAIIAAAVAPPPMSQSQLISRQCNRMARNVYEPIRDRELASLEIKSSQNIKLVRYKYAEKIRLAELACITKAGLKPNSRLSPNISTTGGKYIAAVQTDPNKLNQAIACALKRNVEVRNYANRYPPGIQRTIAYNQASIRVQSECARQYGLPDPTALKFALRKDYSNLRIPTGKIAAATAGCTGLTGATLTACKKAQPAPKPKLVIKPTGYGQAGTGSITKKKILTGTRVVQNRLVPAPSARVSPRRTMATPGLTFRFTTSLADRCIIAAQNYYDKLKSQALSNLARQRGYRSIQEMFSSYNNDRSTRGMAFITEERYNNAKKDAVKNCILRYSSPQLAKEMSEFDNKLRAEPELKST